MSSEIELTDAVGTTISIAPRFLNTFHRNPRRGDIDAIAASIVTNGQYKPIVVNAGTHTGRPNEVLAGNHTLMAMRQLAEQHPFAEGFSMIKAHVLDVDDDMANRIVLVDNRSFEAGQGIDPEIILELLGQVGTTGTGYTDAELDKLAESFGKNNAEPSEPDSADPDDTDTDSEPDTPNLSPRDSAISYTLVFDDKDQESAWFEFIKALREKYPDGDETVAEKLLAWLDDTAAERV